MAYSGFDLGGTPYNPYGFSTINQQPAFGTQLLQSAPVAQPDYLKQAAQFSLDQGRQDFSQIPGVSQIFSNAAAAADPFSSQRSQYQSQLSGLLGGGAQNQVNSDIQSARTISQGAMNNPFMDKLQQLMTDPNSITMTPGAKYAMEQGQNALGRSMAAKGFLGSGNILSELQKQAQGIASQDYSQQLGDLRSAAGLSQNQQAQAFGQANALAGTSGADLNRQVSQLTPLTGATTGSPGSAGNIFSQLYGVRQDALANIGGGMAALGGGVASGSSIAPTSIQSDQTADPWGGQRKRINIGGQWRDMTYQDWVNNGKQGFVSGSSSLLM